MKHPLQTAPNTPLSPSPLTNHNEETHRHKTKLSPHIDKLYAYEGDTKIFHKLVKIKRNKKKIIEFMKTNKNTKKLNQPIHPPPLRPLPSRLPPSPFLLPLDHPQCGNTKNINKTKLSPIINSLHFFL